MNIDYIKSVEKQNEALQAKLEETTSKLDQLEQQVDNIDFLPIFLINHAPKSLIPSYTHSPFIHHNLISAYEIMADFIGDGILTHDSRNSLKDRKRRKPIVITTVDLQCWYLGSLERLFHVTVYYPIMQKYSIAVNIDIQESAIPTWGDDEDSVYLDKIPDTDQVRKRIMQDLRDCHIMHKYVIDQ